MKQTSLHSTTETQQILQAHRADWGDENVALEHAVGRILAENIVADRPFPPFDRVTMDGIALNFRAFEQGKRFFSIEAIQAAGSEPHTLHDAENACIEVMTGAVLPKGCDCVVRYEDLKIVDNIAQITIENIRKAQNIHPKGSDLAAATTLLQRGERLTAAHIATTASVGKAQIRVRCLPRIAVISTGDELVEVADVPTAYQIRRSNSYMVAAWLRQNAGIEADLLHLSDDAAAMQTTLAAALEQYDVLILSGGVSAGKFDFVPSVLTRLGVQTLVQGVAQRPGKPFFFGQTERQTVTVFGLPGNPISTFFCCICYVRQWLWASWGAAWATQTALLANPVTFVPTLTFFPAVRCHFDADNRLWATPIQSTGSGDLLALHLADGFLELPAERSSFFVGEQLNFFSCK
jgi:molybdopterin molybdotransferase